MPASIHETTYGFSDKHRNRKKAHVRIGMLDGMSAHDELYLWGLLSLALSQPEPTADFFATPYYCLRQLGLITSDKRGGREFESFRAALKRLAGIRYQNDAFYDPVRGEHRDVSFGFLNYSLPLDSNSSRSWRFAWDPIFFELASASGGALAFDLALYKDLDAASRRLYLYLKKRFFRADTIEPLNVRSLAVDVLGFSDSLEVKHLKQKVLRCCTQLVDRQLLLLPSNSTSANDLIRKASKGVYTVQLHKGTAFDKSVYPTSMKVKDSPLFDPLRSIGFDVATIHRLMQTYSAKLLTQWSDITLAAIERQAASFFTNSPQAYFMDNVKAASKENRTPPDWWRDLRKKELEQERTQERSKAALLHATTNDHGFDAYLANEAREAFANVMQRLTEDFLKAGKSEPDARCQAKSLARKHFRNRYRKGNNEASDTTGFTTIGSLL
ncbi:MAG: hypothetical protein H6822_20375 [Planctomycetaceae bacterium]|nr:hypothetical protein [Planctomycetaceae bacterium]